MAKRAGADTRDGTRSSGLEPLRGQSSETIKRTIMEHAYEGHGTQHTPRKDGRLILIGPNMSTVNTDSRK